MIEWYDYFQITTLILFFVLTLGRAVHLRLTQRINPIKLGMGKKRSDKVVVFAVLIVAGVQYQIIQEEKFLLVRYGKAYEEYKMRTGRYVRLRRSCD